MALTTDQRNALPASDFAVPDKRKLPMHDANHVSMAWKEVERTQGLSESERAEARKRILNRAKELGMDTSDWHRFKASFEAMSLAVPDVKDHPNRMPFSGIMTWLDEPSDLPVGGSGARRVIVTREAGERAIPSLLGMGVNYTAELDGHDKTKKIGIITAADLHTEGPRGNERHGIHIEGFIYASDFPDAAARIRADKKILGFSWELDARKLADPGADPLVVEDCVFTGAAILRKDKAAYQTTRLAAQASATKDFENMDPEELKKLIAEAVKPVTDGLASVNTRLEKIEAVETDPKKMQAANLTHMVEPHAKALEAAADSMCAAGIGAHETQGHAVIARKMAAHLRMRAAAGELPHIFRDFDLSAAAEKKGVDADAIKTAVEAAVKPLNDKIEAQGTTITDLQAKAFNAAAAPERKTVSGEIVQLLAKGGFEVKDGSKLTVQQADEILAKAGIPVGPRTTEAKLNLQAAGLLAA